MIKKKKSKLTRLKKRKKKLETIAYRKHDIGWFWRWLKLAVDMEGEIIEVGAKKVLVQQTKKRKQLVGGGARGKLHTLKDRGVLGGVLKVQTVSGGKWKKQRGIPHTIKVKGWNAINLNELRRLPKIMNMSEKEKMDHSERWFNKNKHLFEDYNVLFVDNKNKMIDSDSYFTVQIPKTLDRRKIDNQIDEFMKGLKLKTPGGKKSEITFQPGVGVKKDAMRKQWDIFKWRHIEKRSSAFIATNKKSLNYKSGETLQIKGGKTQTQGVRAVQKSYASAKCIIINVSNGIFPKTTL